jgi:hypothetical protein
VADRYLNSLFQAIFLINESSVHIFRLQCSVFFCVGNRMNEKAESLNRCGGKRLDPRAGMITIFLIISSRLCYNHFFRVANIFVLLNLE